MILNKNFVETISTQKRKMKRKTLFFLVSKNYDSCRAVVLIIYIFIRYTVYLYIYRSCVLNLEEIKTGRVNKKNPTKNKNVKLFLAVDIPDLGQERR